MEPDSVLEKFYHNRHLSVVDSYLHKFRYILVLDSDNLVVNMSRSLDHIVNASPVDILHPYRDVDVFMHMREGGEVTASTYFLRNSAYSRCFVEYWRTMAPSEYELHISDNVWIETPNNDNGDLTSMLMNLINVSIALKCSAELRSHQDIVDRHQLYDNKILLCFRMFRGAIVNISMYVPNIKIFFIREDFFRMHTGHTITKENMLLKKDAFCHQNDVIIHGWKELGTKYWPSQTKRNVYGKTVKLKYPHCDIAKFKNGGGANALCRWLNGEAEREIVRKHCYWRSPLCFDDSTSAGSPINTCINHSETGSACWDRERINLIRWPLCFHRGACDPYLSISKIRKVYKSVVESYSPW